MSDITGRPARLADYAPPKHKNGPQLPAVPLPEIHQSDFEGTVREHYAVMADRDALRKEVSDLKTKLAATEAAMMMVEANAIASESRVVSYQVERDKAVSELAELKGKYETVFESMRVLIERFVPPAVTEPAE